MSFVSGTGIGPFIIEREIGRGGMGIVYLARDPRLDRKVAIKALPEHLATDPARLDRFEIEARSLAQLNHPNVAGILGLEEKEGQKFLILEYIEGESLAQRLGRGHLTVEEALDICVQIAAGIEAAHESGLVHRDLKPANVLVTPEGEVKVLDFGLAKMADEPVTAASDEAIHDAPTVTTPHHHSPTLPGVILGTAAYMSPEQARGQPVDKRTDIWSFGVVLYECLSGVGPFAGETANDSIAAILHMDVDHALLPASTPPMVRHLLRGCLQRDKTLRYRDIGDVRLEIVNAGSGEGLLADESRRGPARSTVIGLVLAASFVVAAATWFGKPTPPPTPLPVLNAGVSLPEGTRIVHYANPCLDISPDGQTIAFFYGEEPAEDESVMMMYERRGMMLRRLDQPEAVPVAGPGKDVSSITFSPDGEQIAYWSDGGIHRVPVSGGQSIRVSPARSPCGLTWGDDGTIVVGHKGRGLVRFPSMGGAIDTLTVVDTESNELSHMLPHFIPGSDVVLFTVRRSGHHQDALLPVWSVWALRLSTRERLLVVDHASDARFVNGHVVFMRQGSLFAVPFNPDRLEATGAPRLVLEGVQHSIYGETTNHETGAGLYAISSTGTLAYGQGSVCPEKKCDVVKLDRQGNETLLDIEPRQYLGMRGSPDGKQLLLSTYHEPKRRVWIHDFERGISRLQRCDCEGVDVFGGLGHRSEGATWGPGPGHITRNYLMDNGQSVLVSKPVDGSATDKLVIETPEDTRIRMSDWSRDGKYLTGVDLISWDLWVYTSADGWEPIMETASVTEAWPALSPDGRWLAYGSTESGRWEVLVRPFPGPGPTVQISVDGGNRPVWSRDGSELLFMNRSGWAESSIMAVAATGAAERLEFGPPRRLCEENSIGLGPIRTWDVLADGDFVIIGPFGQDRLRERFFGVYPNRFRVVQNWASTLAERD